MKPVKTLLLLTLATTLSIFITGCETDGDDDDDDRRASTTTTTTVEESRVVPAVTRETRVERY